MTIRTLLFGKERKPSGRLGGVVQKVEKPAHGKHVWTL
jgi:hypothetical protein